MTPYFHLDPGTVSGSFRRLVTVSIVIFSVVTAVAENEKTFQIKPCNADCDQKIMGNPFEIYPGAPAGLGPTQKVNSSISNIFREPSDKTMSQKQKETYDIGTYSTICWIQIRRVVEYKNGSEPTISEEYAISFDTPSDIPDNYVVETHTSEFDKNTKKSYSVPFEIVEITDTTITKESKNITCGSGPIYTREILIWPSINKKRLEIRVSPKKKTIQIDCATESPVNQVVTRLLSSQESDESQKSNEIKASTVPKITIHEKNDESYRIGNTLDEQQTTTEKQDNVVQIKTTGTNEIIDNITKIVVTQTTLNDLEITTESVEHENEFINLSKERNLPKGDTLKETDDLIRHITKLIEKERINTSTKNSINTSPPFEFSTESTNSFLTKVIEDEKEYNKEESLEGIQEKCNNGKNSSCTEKNTVTVDNVTFPTEIAYDVNKNESDVSKIKEGEPIENTALNVSPQLINNTAIPFITVTSAIEKDTKGTTLNQEVDNRILSTLFPEAPMSVSKQSISSSTTESSRFTQINKSRKVLLDKDTSQTLMPSTQGNISTILTNTVDDYTTPFSIKVLSSEEATSTVIDTEQTMFTIPFRTGTEYKELKSPSTHYTIDTDKFTTSFPENIDLIEKKKYPLNKTSSTEIKLAEQDTEYPEAEIPLTEDILMNTSEIFTDAEIITEINEPINKKNVLEEIDQSIKPSSQLTEKPNIGITLIEYTTKQKEGNLDEVTENVEIGTKKIYGILTEKKLKKYTTNPTVDRKKVTTSKQKASDGNIGNITNIEKESDSYESEEIFVEIPDDTEEKDIISTLDQFSRSEYLSTTNVNNLHILDLTVPETSTKISKPEEIASQINLVRNSETTIKYGDNITNTGDNVTNFEDSLDALERKIIEIFPSPEVTTMIPLIFKTTLNPTNIPVTEAEKNVEPNVSSKEMKDILSTSSHESEESITEIVESFGESDEFKTERTTKVKKRTKKIPKYKKIKIVPTSEKSEIFTQTTNETVLEIFNKTVPIFHSSNETEVNIDDLPKFTSKPKAETSFLPKTRMYNDNSDDKTILPPYSQSLDDITSQQVTMDASSEESEQIFTEILESSNSPKEIQKNKFKKRRKFRPKYRTTTEAVTKMSLRMNSEVKNVDISLNSLTNSENSTESTTENLELSEPTYIVSTPLQVLDVSVDILTTDESTDNTRKDRENYMTPTSQPRTVRPDSSLEDWQEITPDTLSEESTSTNKYRIAKTVRKLRKKKIKPELPNKKVFRYTTTDSASYRELDELLTHEDQEKTTILPNKTEDVSEVIKKAPVKSKSAEHENIDMPSTRILVETITPKSDEAMVDSFSIFADEINKSDILDTPRTTKIAGKKKHKRKPKTRLDKIQNLSTKSSHSYDEYSVESSSTVISDTKFPYEQNPGNVQGITSTIPEEMTVVRNITSRTPKLRKHKKMPMSKETVTNVPETELKYRTHELSNEELPSTRFLPDNEDYNIGYSTTTDSSSYESEEIITELIDNMDSTDKPGKYNISRRKKNKQKLPLIKRPPSVSKSINTTPRDDSKYSKFDETTTEIFSFESQELITEIIDKYNTTDEKGKVRKIKKIKHRRRRPKQRFFETSESTIGRFIPLSTRILEDFTTIIPTGEIVSKTIYEKETSPNNHLNESRVEKIVTESIGSQIENSTEYIEYDIEDSSNSKSEKYKKRPRKWKRIHVRRRKPKKGKPEGVTIVSEETIEDINDDVPWVERKTTEAFTEAPLFEAMATLRKDDLFSERNLLKNKTSVESEDTSEYSEEVVSETAGKFGLKIKTTKPKRKKNKKINQNNSFNVHLPQTTEAQSNYKYVVPISATASVSLTSEEEPPPISFTENDNFTTEQITRELVTNKSFNSREGEGIPTEKEVSISEIVTEPELLTKISTKTKKTGETKPENRINFSDSISTILPTTNITLKQQEDSTDLTKNTVSQIGSDYSEETEEVVTEKATIDDSTQTVKYKPRKWRRIHIRKRKPHKGQFVTSQIISEETVEDIEKYLPSQKKKIAKDQFFLQNTEIDPNINSTSLKYKIPKYSKNIKIPKSLNQSMEWSSQESEEIITELITAETITDKIDNLGLIRRKKYKKVPKYKLPTTNIPGNEINIDDSTQPNILPLDLSANETTTQMVSKKDVGSKNMVSNFSHEKLGTDDINSDSFKKGSTVDIEKVDKLPKKWKKIHVRRRKPKKNFTNTGKVLEKDPQLSNIDIHSALKTESNLGVTTPILIPETTSIPSTDVENVIPSTRIMDYGTEDINKKKGNVDLSIVRNDTNSLSTRIMNYNSEEINIKKGNVDSAIVQNNSSFSGTNSESEEISTTMTSLETKNKLNRQRKWKRIHIRRRKSKRGKPVESQIVSEEILENIDGYPLPTKNKISSQNVTPVFSKTTNNSFQEDSKIKPEDEISLRTGFTKDEYTETTIPDYTKSIKEQGNYGKTENEDDPGMVEKSSLDSLDEELSDESSEDKKRFQLFVKKLLEEIEKSPNKLLSQLLPKSKQRSKQHITCDGKEECYEHVNRTIMNKTHVIAKDKDGDKINCYDVGKTTKPISCPENVHNLPELKEVIHSKQISSSAINDLAEIKKLNRILDMLCIKKFHSKLNSRENNKNKSRSSNAQFRSLPSTHSTRRRIKPYPKYRGKRRPRREH